MVIRTVYYGDQNGMLTSVERCVMVIRTVCYGDQNGVLSQQNGVLW